MARVQKVCLGKSGSSLSSWLMVNSSGGLSPKSNDLHFGFLVCLDIQIPLSTAVKLPTQINEAVQCKTDFNR